MDFSLPLKAFLYEHFDVVAMNGGEKMLALSALLAKGTVDELTQQQARKAWLKSILKITPNPSYYHRACSEGWLKPTDKQGTFTVTDKGYEHLESIQVSGTGRTNTSSTKLDIFTTGKTHNFDKFLRTVFSAATTEVLIADSYVDETIFDNLLDQIPENIPISLLYGNKQGSFAPRAKRFGSQYRGFIAKSHGSLHDRFMIVDDIGYIIGPSLKDAARKSPATVVQLNLTDTKKLKKFFGSFWAQAKN